MRQDKDGALRALPAVLVRDHDIELPGVDGTLVAGKADLALRQPALPEAVPAFDGAGGDDPAGHVAGIQNAVAQILCAAVIHGTKILQRQRHRLPRLGQDGEISGQGGCANRPGLGARRPRRHKRLQKGPAVGVDIGKGEILGAEGRGFQPRIIGRAVVQSMRADIVAKGGNRIAAGAGAIKVAAGNIENGKPAACVLAMGQDGLIDRCRLGAREPCDLGDDNQPEV